MVQVKDLRERIKGIQGTQKITKAMKSMSLIRLQRAEIRALASRPFIHAITDIVSRLESDNVYYRGNRSMDALFVIFTSDRGLCGAFNENLIRQAELAINERSGKGKCRLILVGTKGVAHFKNKGHEIYSTYTHLPPNPTASLSNLVMNDCIKLYLEGKAGEIMLVYNNFKSKLKYDVRIKKMLPLPKNPLTEARGMRPIFLYEPEKNQLVDSVVQMFLESTVFHSFLDLYASEYSARLAAMTKATDSAQEMIDRLVQEMNKTRQAFITNEILEIISGAEALAS
jgi:F-type H+-transporting ATPase subunit gamma